MSGLLKLYICDLHPKGDLSPSLHPAEPSKLSHLLRSPELPVVPSSAGFLADTPSLASLTLLVLLSVLNVRATSGHICPRSSASCDLRTLA